MKVIPNPAPYSHSSLTPNFLQKLYAASRISLPCALAGALLLTPFAHALGDPQYVTFAPTPGAFPLLRTPILLADNDYPGVRHAVESITYDIKDVTGTQPEIRSTPNSSEAILVGTIGHSTLIDSLIQNHKLDPDPIRNHWESSLTVVVENPMPGIKRALVIVGADKRGTIFALYALSEQIGVSPWHWWADVRTPHHDALFVTPGPHLAPSPAVQYRGIFLNDEAPALSGWSAEKFGGFNSKFYVHVFELLLRLRANYLWPAMWGSAFNEDDTKNPRLADEYGIVMGTSHHEPMLRAQQEWKRHGTGSWDYSTNAPVLQKFWAEGIARNKNYESTITLGMRGDGDMAMSASTNTALLERIVADQRKILAQNMTPQIAAEPKVWALYKEVQDYYESGMRVPDDVTLLWCDDNWGNIRRLPTAEERRRPGGAGIYYHFDYVGGPVSYKWLNTYNITKVWEQMNLALNYGADRIWIVNVGDLKPMEFPIDFFLTMARNPRLYDQDHLNIFTQEWAKMQFGPEHAAEIAHDLELYTKYNARRKPEMLKPDTFSLTAFHEADQVDQDWRDLQTSVDRLATQLPADEIPSFFELVQYPVDASATVNEMYIAAGRNNLFARQGRAEANQYADQTRRLFAEDATLTERYNHKLLSGRWNHMMDQTHIGYTFWNEPPLNAMPAVQQVQAPEHGTLGFVVEQKNASAGLGAGPQNSGLGTFSAPGQTRTLTLFNRGQSPVSYTASASAPWINLTAASGSVITHQDLQVSIDWKRAPAEAAQSTITVTTSNAPPLYFQLSTQPTATCPTHHGSSLASEASQQPESPCPYLETDGFVSIEAADTTSRTPDDQTHWQTLPGYGKTKSAVTVFPVTMSPQPASQASLNYDLLLTDSGPFTLESILAPTLNFQPGRGLRFAVSLDNGPRQTIDALAHNTEHDWEQAVGDGVRKVSTPLTIPTPGPHTLHVWAMDPGVVLEKLVLAHTLPAPSYLGPPESPRAQ